MNYSKIILFSILFNVVINNNVFSTSLNQSFSNSVNNTTFNTNYLVQNTNEQIYQYLDSRNTTKQFTNTNNTCDYPIADVPSETLQMKSLISYKRVRSHTLTPNITLKSHDKLISNKNLHGNILKSSAQICSISKLNQKELSFYSELYSDSDNDISCKCNINNKSNSRKSTGISPSFTDQEEQNKDETIILQLIQDTVNKNQINSNNSTPVKKDLLNDKEKRTIKYLKENAQIKNNLHLKNLKETNIPMDNNITESTIITKQVQKLKNKIIEIKKDSNDQDIIIRRLNNYAKPIYNEIISMISTSSNSSSAMKELYNSNKAEIAYLNDLILQDIEDSTGLITRFIDNNKTMHGIYDPVYYNTKYETLKSILNKMQEDCKNNKQLQNFLQFYSKQYGKENKLHSIIFNKLPVSLNNLLKEFEYNKDLAIGNYYDTCIVNQDPTNTLKSESINNKYSVKNITNYFYKMKLLHNNTINKNEIQNKFKDVDLQYKNEHINNIIEIYEQWQNIYNKYFELYQKLIKVTK